MHMMIRYVATALSLTSLLVGQRMICVDSSRIVSEVDLLTAVKTQIGQVSNNAGTSAGFAYDSIAGKLYMTSTSLDSVFLIDMTNWSAKLLGPYGVGTQVVMHGIEWDWSTNTLYAAGNAGDFYTVDITTGQATLVGPTGLAGFQNLGYDPLFNVMYVTSSSTDSLYTIDRATGATTLVGPLNGSTNPNSVAYNIDNQTMYLADNITDNLYTLDLATGAANVVASMGSGNVLGLAYIQGTGSLDRAVHGCGPSSIFVTGNPNLAGVVDFSIENATGFAFVGFGVTAVNVPFCGCTIGHDWAVAQLGPNVSLQIPNSAGLLGFEVYAQGLDYLGTGGCAAPQLALSDSIRITIGS